MAEKKYYWLKLDENFFNDDTIQWIEEQDNGKEYVIFYLKLCLKSLTDNGYLIRYVGQKLIPYDVKSLAKLTNTAADTVAVAMKLFIEFGLISRLDSGEIFMNQINEMIGSETEWAKRKRKQRAKEKNLDNVQLLSNESHTDIDKDKDIDKDIDIELNDETLKQKTKKQVKHKYGDYQRVLLTDQQFEELKKEFPQDWEYRINNLDGYIESTGKTYKNHLATIKNWARREKQNHHSKSYYVKPKKQELVPEWFKNQQDATMTGQLKFHDEDHSSIDANGEDIRKSLLELFETGK